jgi:peroxiredoxin
MKKEELKMPKVSINTPAPDFTLENFQGEPTSLSDFKGKSNLILIFNRTFT